MESIRRRGEEWKERLLTLREALGELYAAEAEALSRDLGQWGKRFAISVLLLLAALALGFWLLALLVAVVVAVLAVWLPVWAATLITAGLLALVVGGLALWGWKRLQALGGPIGRVQRRWRDHADWWQERVFDQAGTEERGPEEGEDEPRS